MDEIQIRWSFRRRNKFFPIIEAVGECIRGNAERILMTNALQIIKQAERYKGTIYAEQPKDAEPIDEYSITISFSLIFPSQKEIQEYEKYLRNIQESL